MDARDERELQDDGRAFDSERTTVLDMSAALSGYEDGASDEASEPSSSRPSRAAGGSGGIRRWCLAHQGVTFALIMVIVIVAAIIGFAIALNRIFETADAQARGDADVTSASTTVIDSSLTRLEMRIIALSDTDFPSVSVDFALARDDGDDLPALDADDFTLTERDADGAEEAVTIDRVTFDEQTGTGAITYTAPEDALGSERTLSVALSEESGYRGSASCTYTAPSSASTNAVSTNETEYILPDSATHLYSTSELAGYTADELFIARNEIFARHGRMFGNSYLQEYFESCSWYEPLYEAEEFDAMESPLNDIEVANVNTILSVERSLSGS